MSGLSIIRSNPPTPCPDLFNLAQYVLEAGLSCPKKSALEILGAPGHVKERWSFADLRGAVLGTAWGLWDLGIRPGQKVVLRLGHRADFPICYLAVIALGGIAVPTSSQLTVAEFDRILEDLGDVALVVQDEKLDGPSYRVPILNRRDLSGMRDLPPLPFHASNSNNPAYIVYTSGSSGRPKGVVHAHRAVWARRMMWEGWYGLTSDDRMLHAGAFNWTFTLGTGLLDPWAIGATSLVYQGPSDRHIWSELAHAHSASLFAGAPGVFRQLLSSPRNLSADFSTLRHALCAGEALPASVRMAWEDRTGTDIFEALGMSEVSTFISGSPGQLPVSGSVGRPQPGRSIAILNNGEAVETGEIGSLSVHRDDPGLMLGYHRPDLLPHLPLTGEWFETGDRAKMTAEGDIFYEGRSDALITAGGYRISPEEVEGVLSGHPKIAEAAAIGIEVKEGATLMAAFIVILDDVDDGELRDYMSSHLAAYKIPRLFGRLEALPRSANGKLDRRRLPELWRPT